MADNIFDNVRLKSAPPEGGPALSEDEDVVAPASPPVASRTGNIFDAARAPAAAEAPTTPRTGNIFDDARIPVAAEAPVAPPKQEAPGFLDTLGAAARKGLREGITETGEGLSTISGGFDRDAKRQTAPDAIDAILQKPVTEGWNDPNWWAAQIAYGATKSAPTIGTSVIGGVAGSHVGPIGTIVGAGGGAALGSAIQTVAPAYQRARSEGLEHEAAVDRAIRETGIAAFFGGASAGLGFIRGPLSGALAQIFGVQPAVSVVQHAATSANAGRMPTMNELATTYAVGAGSGAALTGATRAAGLHRKADPSLGPKPEQDIVSRAVSTAIDKIPGATDALTKVRDKVQGWYEPVSRVPDTDAYRTEKHETYGSIAAKETAIRSVADDLARFTRGKADRELTYEVLTNRHYDAAEVAQARATRNDPAASPQARAAAQALLDEHYLGDTARIKNPKLKLAVERARAMFDVMGQTLVDEDLIPQASYDEFRGRYLPRMYLKHILKDGRDSVIGTSAGRTSDQGFAKARDLTLTPQQRALLGEITDPAYLLVEGMSKESRDVHILRFLERLAGNDKWALPDDLVQHRGKMATVFHLRSEAKSLRDRAAVAEGNGDVQNARLMRAEADAMDAKVNSIPVNGVMMTPADVAAHVQTLRQQANAAPTNVQASAINAQADALLQQVAARATRTADAPEGYVRIPDTKQYGRLRGMAVRKEIYDDIIGAQSIVAHNAGAIQKMFGATGVVSKLMPYWKALKVPLNLPTVARNAMSNVIGLHLSGMAPADIPRYVMYAVDQIRKDGAVYQEAKRLGINASGFKHNELVQFSRALVNANKLLTQQWIANKTGGRARTATDAAATVASGVKHLADYGLSKAGDLYQGTETIFKLAKMMHEIDKGASPEKAYGEAQKWLFDYSETPKSISWLRRAPLGSPFITWTYKMLPRVLEAAAKRPLTVAAYAAIPSILKQTVAAMYGVTPEDIEKLKATAPEYMRKKGNAVILPLKDKNGNWQFFDYGYLMPWGNIQEAVESMLDEDKGPMSKVEAARRATGIGGPFADFIAAATTNINPFTGRPIANPEDPPEEKRKAALRYLAGVFGPPMLAPRGAGPESFGYGPNMLHQIVNAYEEKPSRYPGIPSQTLGQAGLRIVGLNVDPLAAESSRRINLSVMQSAISKAESRRNRVLSDRSLTPDERREKAAQYNAHIQNLRRKRAAYAAASTIHPNLATKRASGGGVLGAFQSPFGLPPVDTEGLKQHVDEVMPRPVEEYPGDKLPSPYPEGMLGPTVAPAMATELRTGDDGLQTYYDKDGKPLSAIPRPGVLPVYRDPDAGLRMAMPGFLDIASNAMISATPHAAAAAAARSKGVLQPFQRGAHTPTPAPAPPKPQLAAPASQATPEVNNLGLYSHAANVARGMPQEQGTVEQMVAYMQKMGVKPAELQNMALLDETGNVPAYLAKQRVSRGELADIAGKELPRVEETVKRALKDGLTDGTPYAVADEEFYVLNDMRSRTPAQEARLEYLLGQLYPENGSVYASFDSYAIPGGSNYRELLLRDPAEKEVYKSSHWAEPNVLAHIRMADRTSPDGQKLLHVEEIQSDWGQAARKFKGASRQDYHPSYVAELERLTNELYRYEDAHAALSDRYYGNREGVLPHQLSALRNDMISADQQASALADVRARLIYDMETNRISTPYITQHPYTETTQRWTDLALKRVLKEAVDGGYDRVVFTPGEEQVRRYYGALGGDNDGLAAFYDKVLPAQLNKLVSKAGGKMQPYEMEELGKVPSLAITPQLREYVSKGLPAFRYGGGILDNFRRAS